MNLFSQSNDKLIQPELNYLYLYDFLNFWIIDTCFHSTSPILSTSKAYPTILNQAFSACTTTLISPRIKEKQSFCLTISCWLRSVLFCCLYDNFMKCWCVLNPYYIQRIKESVVFFMFAKPDEAKKINSAFHVSLSTWNYINCP